MVAGSLNKETARRTEHRRMGITDIVVERSSLVGNRMYIETIQMKEGLQQILNRR